MLGEFDVILGRNVLNYHDKVINAGMIDQFDEMLSEGGFLILGTEPAYHHGCPNLFIMERHFSIKSAPRVELS